MWPVMFYQTKWDAIDQHRDELIKVCKQRKTTSNVATTIKYNLYESDFDFLKIDNPSVKALADWCNSSVFQAASNANQGRWTEGERLGINIHESWCHVTDNGGYHDMHQHPMSSWSGIFYLEPGAVDKQTRNGVNRFYRPWDSQYTDSGTRYISQSNSIDLAGDAGTLIIFPSWVPHSAMPYHGDVSRIVIAFNCQFV